jgi:hypothetical protein
MSNPLRNKMSMERNDLIISKMISAMYPYRHLVQAFDLQTYHFENPSKAITTIRSLLFDREALCPIDC